MDEAWTVASTGSNTLFVATAGKISGIRVRVISQFQFDSDLDGIDDLADNCPIDPNPLQIDTDFDGSGDACDQLEIPMCDGMLATVYVGENGVIVGGEFDGQPYQGRLNGAKAQLGEVIVGTILPDDILGRGGDDVICGLDGMDRILGNTGDDTIFGGDGNDWLHGSLGNDIVRGEAGDDLVSGEKGNDTLYGGDGRDTLAGKDGDDMLFGEAGRDT